MNDPSAGAGLTAGWRRQPVFVVLDRSASAGQGILGANGPACAEALLRFLAGVREDRAPLLVAVIVAQDTARVVVPLTPPDRVDPAALALASIGPAGVASLDAALGLVAGLCRDGLVRRGGQCKGDGDPLIFLITDGALAVGPSCDLALLEHGTTVLCGGGPAFEDLENTLHKKVRGRILSFPPDRAGELETVIRETIQQLRTEQEIILHPAGGAGGAGAAAAAVAAAPPPERPAAPPPPEPAGRTPSPPGGVGKGLAIALVAAAMLGGAAWWFLRPKAKPPAEHPSARAVVRVEPARVDFGRLTYRRAEGRVSASKPLVVRRPADAGEVTLTLFRSYTNVLRGEVFDREPQTVQIGKDRQEIPFDFTVQGLQGESLDVKGIVLIGVSPADVAVEPARIPVSARVEPKP